MAEEKHHHHHKDEDKKPADSGLYGGSGVFVEEGIYSETTTGGYGNGGMGGYTTTAFAATEKNPDYEKEAREHKHHKHLDELGASDAGDFALVINHEVSMEAVLKMQEVAQEFVRLPAEEKMKLYSDDPSKTMRLSTSFNRKKEQVHNWRDYLRLHCYPLDQYVPEWPSNPSSFNQMPNGVGERMGSKMALGRKPKETSGNQIPRDMQNKIPNYVYGKMSAVDLRSIGSEDDDGLPIEKVCYGFSGQADEGQSSMNKLEKVCFTDEEDSAKLMRVIEKHYYPCFIDPNSVPYGITGGRDDDGKSICQKLRMLEFPKRDDTAAVTALNAIGAKKASMGHSPRGEVRIDIELPSVNGGDPTANNDPILQANPSTEQWGKVAELVLGISAAAGYNSSSIFPRAANAAGFIASLTAISLRHTAGRATTRILAKFGAIACGAGTLAAIVKDLPNEYIWVAGVAFLIPATMVVFA